MHSSEVSKKGSQKPEGLLQWPILTFSKIQAGGCCPQLQSWITYTTFSFKNIPNGDFFPRPCSLQAYVPYFISNLSLFGFNFQSWSMTIRSLINCWYLQTATNLTLTLYSSDDVIMLTYKAKHSSQFHSSILLPLPNKLIIFKRNYTIWLNK